MPTIHLRVDPVLCGPISIGTVGLIKLLRDCLGLSLAEAKGYVDRCVFGGETVAIPVKTVKLAEMIAGDVAALSSPAGFHVNVDAD